MGVKRWYFHQRHSRLTLELAAGGGVVREQEEPKGTAERVAETCGERELRPLLRQEQLKQSRDKGTWRESRGQAHGGAFEEGCRQIRQPLRRNLLENLLQTIPVRFPRAAHQGNGAKPPRQFVVNEHAARGFQGAQNEERMVIEPRQGFVRENEHLRIDSFASSARVFWSG